MAEDDTDISDNLSDDGLAEVPKVVWKEMILMTQEERNARNALRLTMSGICKEEAWKQYRRVTFAGITKAPGDPDYRPGSVLYDPDVDRRRHYLGKKYRYLLDGLSKLKESPSLPYIRPCNPRLMDVPGRHKWLPPPCRVQMPEHDYDYRLPESISGMCTMVKIYNMMFIDDEKMVDADTQTWRRDFSELAKKWTKHREWVNCRPDVKMEHFDIEEIPTDEKGNPIGKSVGICEWCRKDILPIPTPYVVRHTWDKVNLYCCNKYREFIVGVQDMEKKLIAEHDLKNLKIDIRPNKNQKKKKKKAGQSEGSLANPQSLPGLSADMSPEERKAIMAARVKNIRDKDDAERAMKLLMKEQARHAYLTNLVDKKVDTYDLPWDPYESRFKHGRVFNDQVFDESIFHYYGHADVVMSQSGVFNREQQSQTPRSHKSDRSDPSTLKSEKSSKKVKSLKSNAGSKDPSHSSSREH